MAAETKVFDVANPGSSRPETGSKPMVVGHKNLLDPTLKGPIESESASSEPMAARTEKTLTPTTDAKSEKTSEEAAEKEAVVIASDEKIETPAAPTEEPIVENTPTTDAQPEREAAQETPEQKQKVEDDLEIARSEKLQEMIKNKTYNAPIREAGISSVRTFFKTFIVVAVVGIIVLIILIDAEILDLGVKLPFNFL